MPMATHLQIDDALIVRAVRLGRHKSKRDAVTRALVDYIERLEQQKVLGLFGTVDYDPRYNYKRQRARA
jgi:Arc/MetJ family transcription regulator